MQWPIFGKFDVMTAKKPRHLKIISGTDQPCRRSDLEVELAVLDEAPPAPDWLPNSQATKIWARLAPICIRVGTLTEGTLEKFGHMCAIGGRIQHLYSANETPPMAMHAQFRALSIDFGLSSLAIGKPKTPADGPERKNRFDRFHHPSGKP